MPSADGEEAAYVLMSMLADIITQHPDSVDITAALVRQHVELALFNSHHHATTTRPQANGGCRRGISVLTPCWSTSRQVGRKLGFASRAQIASYAAEQTHDRVE